MQAGQRIVLAGIVDASGGNGGGNFGHWDSAASPGGGGSGGAILLQSRRILVQVLPGRLDIAGGRGGIGVNSSEGGRASPGLLRYEGFEYLDFDTEASKIRPTATELADGWPHWHGPDLPATPADIFSMAQWNPQAIDDPSALSGGQSCWYRPGSDFFRPRFAEDGRVLGWDLNVLINGFGVQSWRGDNDLFGISLEEQFGTDLGTSPLVVRFQGARALGTLDDPCDVDLHGMDSQIVPGSLTGWVKNPWELNDYFPGEPAKRSDMIRFVVIWDASQVLSYLFQGIEDLVVRVRPD